MRQANQIKLLHVVGNSAFGGAARIILRLGQLAKEEGWQADILTTDPTFQDAARQHGIGVVDLDVIRRPIRPLWDLTGLVRLWRFLRRESYTIVHTHTSKGGFVGRLAARLAGVPVIVHTAHGFAFHEQSPVLTRAVYSALERLASYSCDRIAFVSEFHRRWAEKLRMCPPGKMVAIPNGIAPRQKSQRIDPVKLRHELGTPEGGLVALTMGRLAAEKGIEYLIGAAAMLRHSEPRLRIWIAGDGPERAQLKSLAAAQKVADRVIFLGHREDIGDLLAACDVVVLPSLREGLSIALLEAMAAAKPIIATSIGSNLEVAGQADMALIVRPEDSRALYQAIMKCARDQDLRIKLGGHARIHCENRYTEERMLQGYRQVYLDLLQSRYPLSVPAANESHETRLARIS
jgi:glycosyltransferase involved in cell wall biosynthesis